VQKLLLLLSFLWFGCSISGDAIHQFIQFQFSPYLTYSEKIAYLAEATIIHKKELTLWPDNYTDLAVYIDERPDSMLFDSVKFSELSFSEDFRAIEFIHHMDSAEIYFKTDTFNVSRERHKKSNFAEIEGFISIKPDTFNLKEYQVHIDYSDINYFDENLDTLSQEDMYNLWY